VRILFCQNHPKRWTWGSPKSVLRLAEELRVLGHTVEFLFQDDMPAGWRGHRLVFLTFPLFVAQVAIRQASHYDIVDIASGDGWLYGLVRRAWRRGPAFVKRVLSLEHLDWEQRLEEARRGLERVSLRHRLWFGVYRLRQVQSAARLSDHVLCLCETDRRYVVQHHWQPYARTSVVPPGVEDCYFSQENALPQLSERQLAEHYASHVAFVFPSLYEGFGMAFLEAMASGTPVVGTPTGGMADLIEDGKNGLLVARRDAAALSKALERLLDDQAYARSLGDRARATARTFTWERAAHSTLDIYETVLSTRYSTACVARY